jgi:hypothetical protein
MTTLVGIRGAEVQTLMVVVSEDCWIAMDITTLSRDKHKT